MSALRDQLISELTAAGDPEVATQKQRYMKSPDPFHGVTAPEIRRITRRVFLANELADRAEWERTVLDIWRRATHREQRYAAVLLGEERRYRHWLDADSLPMLEEMIVSGAWWDHVDAVATHHLWFVFDADRVGVRPTLVSWSTDDDMWRRRSSIIVQLKAKATTDEGLLFGAIEESIDSKEFFLRKAIGWALREYSKTEPEVVRAYVAANEERLSGLSRREALRQLSRPDSA